MFNLDPMLQIVAALAASLVVFVKPSVDIYKLARPLAASWELPLAAIWFGIFWGLIALIAIGEIGSNIAGLRMTAIIMLAGFLVGIQAVGVTSLHQSSEDKRILARFGGAELDRAPDPVTPHVAPRDEERAA